MKEAIHLGFEVGSGKGVEIPCRHMVVTGQTQEAGKTTTLEGLIARSGLPAIAFVTKRGEQSFAGARRIAPYFRERADWQFVASVLEATMRERLKFERTWIMRASKGAKGLADVQRNVQSLMESTKNSLSKDVYYALNEYLEIVVPRVARVRWASAVDLAPGLNAVDLSDRETFPPELQSLVMRSVLEWVYERCQGTITIIPEAWEFIPQGRGSPVKLSAVELIRKGAGLRNFVWLDSQDIGGIEKELLRSCPVWLLGVQRERNEIGRTLDSIPAGIATPKASDIATLERGQFYACWGKHVVKTYVQPEWMPAREAQQVAMGRMLPWRSAPLTPVVWGGGGEIKEQEQEQEQEGKRKNEVEDEVTKSEADQLRAENRGLREQLVALEREHKKLIEKARVQTGAPTGTEDDLYERVLARLLKEPKVIALQKRRPEIEVSEKVERVQMDTSTIKGRVAKLLSEGFFDAPVKSGVVFTELKRQGVSLAAPRAWEACEELASMGFLTKEGKEGYQAVTGMKVNIVKV